MEPCGSVGVEPATQGVPEFEEPSGNAVAALPVLANFVAKENKRMTSPEWCTAGLSR